METLLTEATVNIEQGMHKIALIEAEDALELAERLRDSEAIAQIEAHIQLIDTILSANNLFDAGNFNDARDMFMTASDYVANLRYIGYDYINEKLVLIEKYLDFYSLIDRAKAFTDTAYYDTALSLYEQAESIASEISFTEGLTLVAEGVAETRELIRKSKQRKAGELLIFGDVYLDEHNYERAIMYYTNALDIYIEIDDEPGIMTAYTKTEHAERKIEEAIAAAKAQAQADAQAAMDNKQEPNQDETIETPPLTIQDENYEHNKTVTFDLTTMIDYQRQRPANLIKMGSTDGRNEGWYNGCGWIATYNALIALDQPQHPADIVKYFETTGGTVFDGKYGTYPNAIEAYLKSFGLNVEQTIVPHMVLNIDDAIKASQVSILAYMHTRAAHYVMIEYRQDIDKFIVYNDTFARTRSQNLGFSNETESGAAIDSVTALIRHTPEILFPFSLITVT